MLCSQVIYNKKGRSVREVGTTLFKEITSCLQRVQNNNRTAENTDIDDVTLVRKGKKSMHATGEQGECMLTERLAPCRERLP